MKLKNLFPVLLMAFPLALTQCNKEEPQNPEKPTPDTPIEKVTLRIENPGTKTTLAGDRQVLWTEGDVVTINGTSYPIEIDAEDSSVATVKDVEKSDTYVGTYLDGGVRTEGQASVSFKSSLTYASGTFSTNENPMIAYSTSETLRFHNAGGILKAGFTSADNVSIKSITLKSNAGEVLAGTYVYNVSDLASDNFNNGTFAENATATSIAVNIAEAVALSTEAQYFYFILPADTYATGLTIDVTDIDGNVTSFTSTGSITINRAEIAEIGSAIEIEGVEIPEDTYDLLGTIVGNVWAEPVALAKDESGYYVAKGLVFDWGINLSSTETASLSEFKIRRNADWELQFGSETAGTVYEINKEASLVSKESGADPMNISFAQTGTFDIYFDPAAVKVWIMTPGYKPGDSVPDIWGLMGDFLNNVWKSDIALVEDGEWLSAKNVTFNTFAFKIRANGTWYIDSTNFGMPKGASAAEINTAIALTDATAGNADITLNGTPGTYDVYFNPSAKEVWVMTCGYRPGDEIPVPDTTISAGATIEEFTKTTIEW